MDNEEKISGLLLDTAWRAIDHHQQRIDKIDDKANYIMGVSGILMTIDSGIIVELIKGNHPIFPFMLMVELILLVVCVYYAFKTIKLKDQGFLNILETFNKFDLKEHIQSTGDVAMEIGNWQKEKLIGLGNDKERNLLKSMDWFTYALRFIVAMAFLVVIFNLFSWRYGTP